MGKNQNRGGESIDFTPYHPFKNCVYLESSISHLKEKQLIPENIYSMYCRYHSTVSHKLKSARFFLGKINDLASPDFLEENEPFEYQSYRHEVNRNLDCFLFSVGASLDVLAREVLGYFDLIGNEPNIYYVYAKKKLTQTNKGSW